MQSVSRSCHMRVGLGQCSRRATERCDGTKAILVIVRCSPATQHRKVGSTTTSPSAQDSGPESAANPTRITARIGHRIRVGMGSRKPSRSAAKERTFLTSPRSQTPALAGRETQRQILSVTVRSGRRRKRRIDDSLLLNALAC